MELSYLNEFITLAHTCHYQMTAELSFISQSSLSKHIKKMEDELGVELFTHSRYHVQLTEFGKIFLPYAEEIVGIEHQYRLKLNEYLHSGKREIKIGVMSVEALAEVAEMLPVFKKKYPNSTLTVLEGNRSDVMDWLNNEDVNVIFLRERTELRETGYHLVQAGKAQPLVALISVQHRLSGLDRIPFEELRNEIFISSQTNSLKGQLTEELCKAHGFNLNSNLIIRNSAAVVKLVENNMALMLLFRDEARRMATENTKIVSIEPTCFADTYIFYSKKNCLSQEELWLIGYFRSKWKK